MGRLQHLWWWLRRTSKYLLARSRLVTVLEYCGQCGRQVAVIWWVDDPLWRQVMQTPYGCLCPACFDAAMQARGVLLCWRPEVIPVPQVGGHERAAAHGRPVGE